MALNFHEQEIHWHVRAFKGVRLIHTPRDRHLLAPSVAELSLSRFELSNSYSITQVTPVSTLNSTSPPAAEIARSQ